ncbi:hypothetical protein [Spiroplasma endosymbiont of Amphibalanus improvisus]|uniref:hypothetical protein n=1 Tax=Spiroplasma endosymbiont of Amphibalanus improvisus TaxID=3066327 RepID=UPI00313AAC37
MANDLIKEMILNEEIKLFFPENVQVEFRILPTSDKEQVKFLIMSNSQQIEFINSSKVIKKSIIWILQQNFLDKKINLTLEVF